MHNIAAKIETHRSIEKEFKAYFSSEDFAELCARIVALFDEHGEPWSAHVPGNRYTYYGISSEDNAATFEDYFRGETDYVYFSLDWLTDFDAQAASLVTEFESRAAEREEKKAQEKARLEKAEREHYERLHAKYGKEPHPW